jgi:hypothetical protein
MHVTPSNNVEALAAGDANRGQATVAPLVLEGQRVSGGGL